MATEGNHGRALVRRLIERTQSQELRWKAVGATPLAFSASARGRTFTANRRGFRYELSASMFKTDPYSLSVWETGKGPDPVVVLTSSVIGPHSTNELLRELYKLVDSCVEDEDSVIQRILDEL